MRCEIPGSAAEPTEPAMEPCRILVVDDYVPAAIAVTRLLQLAGHDVHTVFTAKDVLDAARALRPDVIFLDLSLPGGQDGVEIALRLRAERGLEGTVIVALSGRIDAGTDDRFAGARFDYHLLKPVSAGEMESVMTMVRLRRSAGSTNGRLAT